MIAGPGELWDEELDVMGGQIIAHYGDVWTSLHSQVLADLSNLMGAADLPYLIPGSGSTCLDAAVMNLFEPGQRVVVADTGFFGVRLMEVARANRLEVVQFPVPVGEAIDAGKLTEFARTADGILTVHVDTSTGVRHPIAEIAAVARDVDAIYMVDGIASVGGETLNVDEMGIDAVVTSTQKGLETPPGLGIIALGPRARTRIENRSEPPPSWYLDLARWDFYRKEWGAWHPHPVTMPTSLVLVLASSLSRLLGRGIDQFIDERADLARYCREGLQDLGLAPVPEPGLGANLVVASYADDPLSIVKHLLSKGIQISGGLDPLSGRTIRVGLMGRTATKEMVDRVLEGVGQATRN